MLRTYSDHVIKTFLSSCNFRPSLYKIQQNACADRFISSHTKTAVGLLGFIRIINTSRTTMAGLAGGIRPVEGNQNSLEINSLARFAVDEHNKKENSMLEFGKVVSARQQVVAGTMYYITLEASDGGVRKVYDAKVWVKPWLNFKGLQDFKLVGNTSS